MENRIKRRTLFSLRRLPQVIELYANMKRRNGGNPPEYYAFHLDHWLRNYAVPGKPDGGGWYPDGRRLPRGDANLINSSVGDILWNFVFLKPGLSSKKARKVAGAFIRASKIFWNEKRKAAFHLACVLEKPEAYLPLHRCLLGLLNSSRYDNRQEEEIERIAEYLVIYCQSDRKVLKELALKYHRTDKERDENACYLPSADD